jgi:hypothetical protein
MGRKLENGEDFTDTYGLRTRKIPVDLSSGTPVKVRYFALKVEPGDYLKVHAEIDVTNDAGRETTKGIRYTVGVGISLWWYNASIATTPVDLRTPTWKQIGASRGMNCTVDLHHLAMDITGEVTIPDDWPVGHSAGICLRADAHSTRWNANDPDGGDWVDIENHGGLTVTRYRASPPPVDDPRWAQLAALEQRVAALETPTPPEVLPCP